MPLPEKLMIGRIRRAAALAARRSRAGAGLIAGIGDDCAILQLAPTDELLVTTDFTLEGIHFRREWHPPEAAGHRCLARGLSDIAAMGGFPLACFLSLALPRAILQSWVDRFMRGIFQLAEDFAVPLAGGDVAESPAGLLADIVVLGRVPAGEALRRSGARPGDAIYVTGELGGSAATLARLQKNLRGGPPPRVRGRDPHYFPTPRIRPGLWLRERQVASAAIDISDGLSTDLAHICEESGVGAIVHADAVSLARGATLELALHGGEDYELLFTAPSRVPVPNRIAGVPVIRIGEITKSSRIWLQDALGKRRPLEARGWEHFSGGAVRRTR